MLGVLDIMGVEVQDREQVDSERESRGTREGGRRQNKETTNARTCDDMSDTSCDTLSHNVMCAQSQICREKLSCEVYLSTHAKETDESASDVVVYGMVR